MVSYVLELWLSGRDSVVAAAELPFENANGRVGKADDREKVDTG